MARKRRKIFVLDTNVILHDSSCIEQFEENDIVIPITVLEELDKFKTGNESINYHAREFSRTLDGLSEDKLFGTGVKIGEKKGKITIKLEQGFHPDVADNFTPQKADHHIINAAYQISKSSTKEVILVSKDVNLRMKSKAIGLLAQDYKTDHIKDIKALYNGCRVIDDISSDKVDGIYGEASEVTTDGISVKEELLPNEYVILKSGKKSALAKKAPYESVLKRVDKKSVYRITPKNAEQTFAFDALTDPDVKLVSLCGKAGTGKTLLAIAAALEQQEDYRQIYVARPIVPLSNKDIGFLPGDIKSKIGPYMQPLYDNLGVIKEQYDLNGRLKIQDMVNKETLMITPLAYIRGRSLVNVFFIVDEAQNLTPHEVKTIITRAGEGAKIIFTGDIFQIDHPYLDAHSNGLSYLIEKMMGQKLFAHINLKKGERSELAEIASDLL